MQIGAVRSGLIEARHDVSMAAVDATGAVVLTDGPDIDRPFYFRSAAKPFQAAEIQAAGADLVAEELAVAMASHSAEPVHLAIVRAILARAGLAEDDLRCPPAWPSLEAVAWLAAGAGDRQPRRIFHNCSGKHSGMLAASVASGWSLDYTDPEHPLQRRIHARVADASGADPGPVGVDGCGVPAFRGTVVGLARAFARLAVDDEYAQVRATGARFAALLSGEERVEVQLVRWVPGMAKRGAAGCLGLAWYGGVGIAAKCWSGDGTVAAIGVVETLRRLGILPDHPASMLADVARPPVFGGGRVVGRLEPVP